jgi:hypothetical protein
MRRALASLQLAAAPCADLGQKSGPCQTTIRGASTSLEPLTRRLLYSGNRERQLLGSSPLGIGQPCRVRASLRSRRQSPQDGIRKEGRTICSTAMSLSRPPQRADLPFPSSPARDIPPPGGGARRSRSFCRSSVFYAVAGCPHWYAVPLAHMRWRMTPRRRATATMARRSPRLRAIFMPHAFRAHHLVSRIITA